MKVKTTNTDLAGTIVNFPEVGHQQVDADGVVDIREDIALKLIVADDWNLVDELAEENEGNTDENEGTEGNVEGTEKKTRPGAKKKAVVKDELSDMEYADLLELAKAAKIKSPHLFKNKLETLRSLIRKAIEKKQSEEQ